MLTVEVGRSMPAGQVKAVLRRLFAERQPPGYIRSDNGPEFIAHELTGWLTERGVQTHHIAPRSPWQNAYGEKLQRGAAAGVPEPGVVPWRPRCEGEDRAVAAEVQSRAAAQRVGVPNA